jgi:hypothetical protein
MPKQIITSPSAPTTGFTPGQSVSPLAQAIRFGKAAFSQPHGVQARPVLLNAGRSPRGREFAAKHSS